MCSNRCENDKIEIPSDPQPVKETQMIIKVGQKVTLASLVLLSGCQQLLPQAPATPPSWNLGEINEIYRVSSIADSGPNTLREAIQKANASPGTDKIVFESDDDLYQKPQTIHLESALPEITENLHIDGYIEDMLWKVSGVTIDGGSKNAIFAIAPSATAKIEYLTLANGYSSKGGAIANLGELVLSSTMLMNNTGKRGGAVYNKGHLQVINSSLYSNDAGWSGSAIYNDGGNLVLTHITVFQNRSKDGIAVYNKGNLLVRNSILYGNLNLAGTLGTDCLSKGQHSIESARNIMGTSDSCGEIFSSEDPIVGSPGVFNGPTVSLPISTNGPAFNWAENELSVDENGEPLYWDQRGNGDPRYAGGIADIGAFEVQPIIKIEVDTLSDEEIRGCTSSFNDCSLSGAIALTNYSPRYSTITFDKTVFDHTVTLHIDDTVVVKKDLTLDASDVAPVTIKTGSEGILTATPEVQVKTHNVQFSH